MSGADYNRRGRCWQCRQGRRCTCFDADASWYAAWRRRQARAVAWIVAMLAIALAALLLPRACQAQDITGHDKLDHVVVSAGFGLLASGLTHSRPRAYAIGLSAGLVKELVDAERGGTGFSGRDMAANLLGVAIGVEFGRWISVRSMRGGGVYVEMRTEF